MLRWQKVKTAAEKNAMHYSKMRPEGREDNNPRSNVPGSRFPLPFLPLSLFLILIFCCRFS